MPNVRLLVLDVLKPHDPTNIELSEKISTVEGVHSVHTVSEEVDQETESLKVTIEGAKLNFSEIKKIIEECGAAVHSIDEVTVNDRPGSRQVRKTKG